MATQGVYAEDLAVGDIVRIDKQVWRVSGVDRMGRDEVEVNLVTPDDTDQLVVNMLSGQIVERVT